MKKKLLLFFTILMIACMVCVLNRCSIAPWKTIRFISCREYYKINTREGFLELTEKYPDSYLNGVFLYSLSQTQEQYMYKNKGAYRINFVLYHYDPNVRIRINSIKIKEEKDEVFPIKYDFPIDIETERFINYKINKETGINEKQISDYYSGVFHTEYIYDFKKSDAVEIEIEVEVDNDSIVEKTVIKQKLEKEINKGVFKFG